MNNRTQVMVDYLLLCVELEDWHGVSDAANDLRVIEARRETIDQLVAKDGLLCEKTVTNGQ